MKREKDRDLEFIDLDEEPEEENFADAFDAELDEKTVRFVRRVLFPAVIAFVAVIVAGAALFLFLSGRESKEEARAAMELLSAREEMEQEPSSGTDGEEDASREAEEDASPDGRAKSGKQEGEETAPEADSAEALLAQDAEDPQTETMGTEAGTEVDVGKLLSSGAAAETEQLSFGIDVARYQGTIDWAQVAASGVDFAMVRTGYRMESTREIVADSNARYNMQEAQKNGIKLGVYFFSTAVSEAEAVEEANWVADYIAKYRITYPVAYDCEGFERADSPQYGLTKETRTDIAIAFLNRIYERGYTPMFYASMGELAGDAKWVTSRLDGTYKIWVSQYPASPYPQTEKSSYQGVHAMWQYTNRGTVAGIGRPVDVNIAYFGYEGTAEAQSGEAPEEAQADVEALMRFTEVNEEVTAKENTNLRNMPSQGGDSTVVYTLPNGETLTRTGISDSGWSRLTYNGQTVYAVSSYLTTDLGYQAPKETAQEGAGSGDGLKTRFSERSEQVTAKIEVNLRTLPSVTNPDAAVAAVLHNGEYATRTGINEDYGWSRVEYNGQTLYCISSYLTQ